MTVAYGCCVGDWERFGRYVAPHIPAGRSLLALSGQTSIAVAYNIILDAYTERGGIEAVILLHDDLELLDPDTEAKLLAALTDPGVALVGVAGGSNFPGLAWWEGETVGHQHTDTGLLDFGRREGDVEHVEGSVMALAPWAFAGRLDRRLSFDEGYPGFHGYDEIGTAVRRRNLRVRVVDVATHHHTRTGFDSDSSAAQWQAADSRYRAKWGKP